MREFIQNVCEAGSEYREILQPVVEKDGSIEVKVVGHENLNDYIQSFAKTCDINYVMARYASGDESVLNARPVMYGDFTQMPKTYAEMLQLVIDGQNLFNSLPNDIKVKFDDDFNKFFALAGTDEFNKVFKEYADGVRDPEPAELINNTDSISEKVEIAGDN